MFAQIDTQDRSTCSSNILPAGLDGQKEASRRKKKRGMGFLPYAQVGEMTYRLAQDPFSFPDCVHRVSNRKPRSTSN